MAYHFDQIIDRRGTLSVKYDTAGHGKPEHVLPMWVADMDFQTPPCVTEALIKRCQHGIFGYSATGDDYFTTLAQWFDRHFGWSIAPAWLVKTPGVVTAVQLAVLALTQPDDSILIQPPVYYPFASVVQVTGRRLVLNPLRCENGFYRIDFQDFEQKIISQKVKLFILCSPHNPAGRVWTREELQQLGAVCLRHGVRVVSDEIHQDFVYAPHRHQVFAALSDALRDITITCTAPTKTFNLAGLPISNIFIADSTLRTLFTEAYRKAGESQIGILSVVACQAAYAGGDDWLQALLAYLMENFNYLRSFLARHLPQIKLVEPEGTYLAWLDCRALGLDDDALDALILHKAGLWLDDGRMFGAGGEGFQRVNMACPRAVLQDALERLRAAISALPERK